MYRPTNTILIYGDGYLWRNGEGDEIITLERWDNTNYCEVTAGTIDNGIYSYFVEDQKQFSGDVTLKFDGSAVHYNKGKVTVKTYYNHGYFDEGYRYELERTERYNIEDVVPITELFTPHTEGYSASFYIGDIKKNPDIIFSQFAYVRNENNDESFKQLLYSDKMPKLYDLETGEFSEDAMGWTISITYQEYTKEID